MLNVFPVALLFTCATAWSGIVLDGGLRSNGETNVARTQIVTTNFEIEATSLGLTHVYGAATLMVGGKMYIIGGVMKGKVYSRYTQMMDPRMNTTAKIAPRSMATAEHFASYLPLQNGILLCGGREADAGEQNVVPLAKCSMLHVDSHEWRSVASLPTGLRLATMVTLNGKAIVFGGLNAYQFEQSKAYSYDATVDEWTVVRDMPLALFDAPAIALDDDRAMICGGVNRNVFSNECFVYSASANAWTKGHPLRTARVSYNLVRFNGRIYALAGNVKSTIEVYDAATGWQALPQNASALRDTFRSAAAVMN